MDALTLLHQRNSAAKLTNPAPGPAAREQILRAALRAPDHGRLQPWRFLCIEGDARGRLGELFAAALLQRNPAASAGELDKNRDAPLRAPLIVAVIARLREHPKVPQVEQLLSAGCAAHAMLLAAHALGYGAIWRTGDNCYDDTVKAGLGLEPGEAIVGFVYLGTNAAPPKPLPELHLDDFVSNWA